jgi:hypothetical protein
MEERMHDSLEEGGQGVGIIRKVVVIGVMVTLLS